MIIWFWFMYFKICSIEQNNNIKVIRINISFFFFLTLSFKNHVIMHLLAIWNFKSNHRKSYQHKNDNSVIFLNLLFLLKQNFLWLIKHHQEFLTYCSRYITKCTCRILANNHNHEAKQRGKMVNSFYVNFYYHEDDVKHNQEILTENSYM